MTDTTIPAISILLPTYNGARYLAEQLDSILVQSFANFELVMVDDGSTDATRAITAEFAQRDKRIRIIPSKDNHGQKKRLIELLEVARAPLIAISDQDDVWEPVKVERLMASLGDSALAFGRSDLIDGEGHPFNRSLLDTLRSPYLPGDRLGLLFRPQVSGHAMLARRDVMTNEAFRTIHPFDWLISLVAVFSDGIAYDDAAVVRHRIHGANSHNDLVRIRLNLLLVRLQDFAEAYRRTRGWRRRFVDGLEFLSASPLVPESKRAIFKNLADRCRAAWFDVKRRRVTDAYLLRRVMLDTLRPLAGSATDWQIVVAHVNFLTLGLFHPLTLVGLKQLF